MDQAMTTQNHIQTRAAQHMKDARRIGWRGQRLICDYVAHALEDDGYTPDAAEAAAQVAWTRNTT